MSQASRPDLCIVGAGAAGLSVAASAAAFGVSTVLIERGAMGGECLNTGCVPSKALIAAARAAHGPPAALRGVRGEGPAASPDFAAAMAHVRATIAAIAPSDSVERFTALGVRVVKGEAAFVDRQTVRCGDVLVRARRFVVAAGSKPTIPDIAGLAAAPYLTNETIFGLNARPEHLLVIGAGPMGCELGQAFRRLGSEVTLLDAGEALPREDREFAGIVAGALARDGVALHAGARIKSVDATAAGVRLRFTDAAGEAREVAGTHLLVAAGRTPATAYLGLDAGWIKHDKGGIVVDDRMRTSNRRVFAIGDCVAGNERFTHAASQQASVVIRNALFRLPARFDPLTLPRVTYTDPEIAWVGLDEARAGARHGPIRVLRVPLGETDRARTEGETEGLLKVVATARGRILGAGICGRGAGEMISLWTLALAQKAKLSRIAALPVPYPTVSEAARRAALDFYAPLARRPLVRGALRWLRALG